jgi:hypothetical protein
MKFPPIIDTLDSNTTDQDPLTLKKSIKSQQQESKKMFNDLFPHTAKKEPDIITK